MRFLQQCIIHNDRYNLVATDRRLKTLDWTDQQALRFPGMQGPAREKLNLARFAINGTQFKLLIIILLKMV